MDTSCGMAVIFTVRAEYRPTAEPSRVPTISKAQPIGLTVPSWISRTSVAAMAITMPAVDTWLPRRAVAGEFIRCRPMTKHAAAIT
jgi:hypothetical protein